MRKPPFILVPVYFQSKQWVLPRTVIAPSGFFSTDPVLLVPEPDHQKLSQGLTQAILFGNPSARTASWNKASAMAVALGFKTEGQFEKGARLFLVKVFSDRVEVSEMQKASRHGFGGPPFELRVFAKSASPQEIANDLHARVEPSRP